MLQLEVLIYGTDESNFLGPESLPQLAVRTVKPFSVDRTPACPVMPREIAALQHELIR